MHMTDLHNLLECLCRGACWLKARPLKIMQLNSFETNPNLHDIG